jgi:hypothetical protein
MAWWSTAPELKRKNRFYVDFGTGGKLFSVTSVSKPTVNIEAKEYQLINHFYKYPGVPKWDPITIKFVDAGVWGSDKMTIGGAEAVQAYDKSTSQTLWEMLLASGYVTPSGLESALPNKGNNKLMPVVSPEKAAMIDRSFGSSFNETSGDQLKIYQVNADGETTETWSLYNPIITKISWGDLDYTSDDAVEFTLDVAYDWAELTEGKTQIGEK